MRNIALRLMYDGSAYHGWQVQKNAVSVAGTLETALSKTCGHDVKLTGCGRTDAGVHALIYCANFKTPCPIPADRLPLAINSRLARDIVITAAFDAPEDFNAISSCRRKEYKYFILNSRVGNPFLENRACFYPFALDTPLMSGAAAAFEGTHDFAAVRSTGTYTKSSIRTVFRCRVERFEDIIEISICANGFLYNMARSIVGTIVYAGLKKLSPEDIPTILAAKDRRLAGPTMPPQGLYLSKLWYDDPVGVMFNMPFYRNDLLFDKKFLSFS